jgi:hypothetical protein
MARFTIGAEEVTRPRDIGFAEFIQVAIGRSIVSGADWGNEPVEFGSSGDAMLRIFLRSNGIEVNLISTTNQGDMPPLLPDLPEEHRRLSLREVERRLSALRTLHAMVHLLDTGRAAIFKNDLSARLIAVGRINFRTGGRAIPRPAKSLIRF